MSSELIRPRDFGPYQLVRRVGGGGMANIYLARTGGIEGFEKHLALKMIREVHSADQTFIDMLVNEAKIAVRLSHSNIVQVFDLGKIDGLYYLAMEFVDGCDLHALLVQTSESGRFIPFEVAAYMIQETCVGLFYAHERLNEHGLPMSIVHRDISPHNILLSYTGDVKVADFGIAKANVRREETQLGVLKGKFNYMSPEQAQGEGLDARSDLFSLGIVFYELLTGQMLFRDTKPIDLLNKVRAAKIPLPSSIRREIPLPLERVAMKALSRDRGDRYDNADEMRRDIAQFLSRYAPGFSSSDLSDYLFKTMGSEGILTATGQNLQPEITPGDSDVVTSDNNKLPLMERGEYQLDASTSLVFSFSNLKAISKMGPKKRTPAGPPQKTAKETTRSFKRPAFGKSDEELDLEAIQSESLRLAQTAQSQDEDIEETRLADRGAIQEAFAAMQKSAVGALLPESDVPSLHEATNVVRKSSVKRVRVQDLKHAELGGHQRAAQPPLRDPTPPPSKSVRTLPRKKASSMPSLFSNPNASQQKRRERFVWWVLGGFALVTVAIALALLL